jgi:regulator of sirC expression with transglutaminase-like and TPR domain
MNLERPTGKIESESREEPIPTVLDMGRRGRGAKDRWAVAVFFVALSILVVLCALAVKDLSRDSLVRPMEQVRGWLKDMGLVDQEGRGKRVRDRDSRKDPTVSARKHLVRGYRLYRKGRLNDAVAQYSKAIEMDSKNPEAFYWRGRAWFRMEQYDQAMNDFKRAIALRSGYAEAWDNLAWLYLRRKEYPQAVACLTRSIDLNSNNGWAYHTRGRCYFQMGLLDQALKDASKACQLGFRPGCEAVERYKGSPKGGESPQGGGAGR